MPKILTSQDLLTMIIKGHDISNIYVTNLEYRDRGMFYLCPCKTSLLLSDIFKPEILILDISKEEEAKPAKNGLLSKEALTFLGSCNYITRPHNERQALIVLAKTLYPNTSTDEE